MKSIFDSEDGYDSDEETVTWKDWLWMACIALVAVALVWWIVWWMF